MTSCTRYLPEALLAKYRAIRETISDQEFFRSPRHQKTMEIWCAAHFARAYSSYVHACNVLIDDTDVQTDVDFELELAGTIHPFQVTEVMEPGRRRGDEYRDDAPSGARADDIELGTRMGAEWVRTALERKLSKNYAAMDRLNLLTYLNFAGRNQEYVALRHACLEVSKRFASVWLLNGNTLCCIRHNEQIAAWEGWMVIEESPVAADA